MASRKSYTVVARRAREVLSPVVLDWFLELRLLTSDEVGEALGLQPSTRQVSRWWAGGQLVGLPVSRGYVYPGFQIDEEKLRLRPDVVRFNLATQSWREPWRQLEAWFLDGHPGA